MPGAAAWLAWWSGMATAVTNAMLNEWGPILATLLIACLGGLIHSVYRLGKLTEKVEGLTDDVNDLRNRVNPLPWVRQRENPDRDRP
jgi:steroid 5-alpha reductase family enzyme